MLLSSFVLNVSHICSALWSCVQPVLHAVCIYSIHLPLPVWPVHPHPLWPVLDFSSVSLVCMTILPQDQSMIHLCTEKRVLEKKLWVWVLAFNSNRVYTGGAAWAGACVVKPEVETSSADLTHSGDRFSSANADFHSDYFWHSLSDRPYQRSYRSSIAEVYCRRKRWETWLSINFLPGAHL